MELLLTVKSSEAPLLNELEDDEAAAAMARPGDLLLEGKSISGMAKPWKASFEGRPYERSGPMSEVRQAPGDAILYGFKVDLGEQVVVPVTTWICARMMKEPGLAVGAAAPGCARLLRRARLKDGTLLAFVPCSSVPCPVALVRSNEVRAIAVEGISGALVVQGEGGPVLLATTRWVRAEGKWTGGALVPIALGSGAPVALTPIVLDEVDARDPAKVVARMVQFELSFPSPDRTMVHLTGDRRESALPDGRELAKVAVDERVVVPGR